MRVDRPLGSTHPRHPDIQYPLNYGFVPGTLAPDGEPLDVYVLGPDTPLVHCDATIVGIVRRRDDVEDKLVAVADGYEHARWSSQAIARATWFQERYFDATIECAPPAARG